MRSEVFRAWRSQKIHRRNDTKPLGYDFLKKLKKEFEVWSKAIETLICEIIAENFKNLRKMWTFRYRRHLEPQTYMTSKKPFQHYTIVKMSRLQKKERTLEAARENKTKQNTKLLIKVNRSA